MAVLNNAERMPVITDWEDVDSPRHDHKDRFRVVCEDCFRGWECTNELAATQQALLHLLMGPLLYPEEQHIELWIFPAAEDLT